MIYTSMHLPVLSDARVRCDVRRADAYQEALASPLAAVAAAAAFHFVHAATA